MSLHKTHPEVIKRLERAAGHLASVIGMLREGRGCLEVTQQLQAVESAIANAKKTLVHDHIDHCLGEAVNKGARGGTDAIREFKQITRYL
jgi:DNA-binding FrmR family transcriptional regulator